SITNLPEEVIGASFLNLLYKSITVLSNSVLRKKSIAARLLAMFLCSRIAHHAIPAAPNAINAVAIGASLAAISNKPISLTMKAMAVGCGFEIRTLAQSPVIFALHQSS